MKIRTQLIYLLLVSLALVLFSNGLRFYANHQHSQAMERNHYITNIRLYSERTFRGINDIFLTEGSPESIRIARSSFDEVKQKLILLDTNRRDHELIDIIRAWEDIGIHLAPFLIENNPDLNTLDMQVRYGKMLTIFEQLMRSADQYNQKNSEQVHQTLDVSYYVSLFTMLLVILWVLFVYQRLTIRMISPITWLSKKLEILSDTRIISDGKKVSQQAELVTQKFENYQTEPLEEIAKLGDNAATLLSKLGQTLYENKLYTLTLEQEAELLEHETRHDLLTKLPNRKMFVNSLEQAVKDSAMNSSITAVFFIDLDGFKQVNDTWGHAVGDLLLIEVAHRLQSSIRSKDAVCRLGGDEFAAVIVGASDLATIKSIATRTIKALEVDFSIDQRLLQVSCSIGISLYPKHGLTAKGLIEMADSAMYQAKHNGKGQYHLYTASARSRDGQLDGHHRSPAIENVTPLKKRGS